MIKCVPSWCSSYAMTLYAVNNVQSCKDYTHTYRTVCSVTGHLMVHQSLSPTPASMSHVQLAAQPPTRRRPTSTNALYAFLFHSCSGEFFGCELTSQLPVCRLPCMCVCARARARAHVYLKATRSNCLILVDLGLYLLDISEYLLSVIDRRREQT